MGRDDRVMVQKDERSNRDSIRTLFRRKVFREYYVL